MAEKITLSSLETMSVEDLKTLRKAIGMVLAYKGAVITRKAK